MKAHDILGISVTADKKQIENAYSEKLSKLEGDFSKQFPKTYERRVNELNQARQACIEYLNTSFSEKVKRELKDCAKAPFEANRTNGCCEAMGFGDCCCYWIVDFFCWLMIIAGIIAAIASAITGAADRKKQNEQNEIKYRSQKRDEYNRQLTEKRPAFDAAKREIETLREQISIAEDKLRAVKGDVDEFHLKIKLLNSFLSVYGCNINENRSGAYSDYLEKLKAASREISELKSRLEKDNKIIDDFLETQKNFDSYSS